MHFGRVARLPALFGDIWRAWTSHRRMIVHDVPYCMQYGPGPAPGVVGSVGELSALNVNRECVCERNAHTYTFLLTRERKVRLSKSVPTATPGGAALKAPPPAGVLRFHFLLY
jgi:hypothetical protein